MEDWPHRSVNNNSKNGQRYSNWIYTIWVSSRNRTRGGKRNGKTEIQSKLLAPRAIPFKYFSSIFFFSTPRRISRGTLPSPHPASRLKIHQLSRRNRERDFIDIWKIRRISRPEFTADVSHKMDHVIKTSSLRRRPYSKNTDFYYKKLRLIHENRDLTRSFDLSDVSLVWQSSRYGKWQIYVYSPLYKDSKQNS